MLCTGFELWKLCYFWEEGRSLCPHIWSNIQHESGNLCWTPTVCCWGNRAANKVDKFSTSWNFLSISASSGQVYSSSYFLSRHFSGTHISTHSNCHSSVCKITLLPNMNWVWLCLSEKFSYTDGLTIYLFFQLQQFCSNMLEEHQRLTVQAKLQTIKNENLKNKERNARIAAWLRKNT